MLIDTFKGTVFQEELETSLFTNLSNSWNIIGLITHEGLEVDELRWGNPHFLHEVVRCEGLKLSHTFLRNLNDCVFVSQLNQVFIPWDNRDLIVFTGVFSHLSQGTDNVVCLVLSQVIIGDTTCSQHLTDIRELLTKFLWSLGTTSLVVCKHLCTESCFPSIKGYQNMSRLDTLKQVVQHKVETVDSIGMKAIIVTKTVNLIIKCEKGTKGNGWTVN